MPLPTITNFPPPPSRADTPANFNTLADAFLQTFPGFVAEINSWAAALPAMVNGIDYNGTSTTSVTIGLGTKNFTTQTGKNFQIGQSIRVAATSAPAGYMDGQVTAYTSATGALVVNVTSINDGGTFAAWTISLAVSGASVVTLTGTDTLTNKTLTTPVLSGTASGIVSGRLGYAAGVLSFGNGSAQLVVVTTTSTQTLTGKTIDTAGTNTIKVNGNTLAAAAGTGTITFFITNDTVVGRATTDTLTNKTLTAPAINGATLDAATVVSDTGTIATNSVGFRGAPQSSNTTGTLALTDNAKFIPTAGNWTIPANASIPCPIGFVAKIINTSGAPITVSITTDTLRQSGTSNTGTRTVAAYGEVIVHKIAATEWRAAGHIS